MLAIASKFRVRRRGLMRHSRGSDDHFVPNRTMGATADEDGHYCCAVAL